MFSKNVTNYMKINLRIILIGFMVSILLISSYSCESNLGDKDDLQDTQIFEKNETQTRIPTLVPVIDDIPSTVEPLI